MSWSGTCNLFTILRYVVICYLLIYNTMLLNILLIYHTLITSITLVFPSEKKKIALQPVSLEPCCSPRPSAPSCTLVLWKQFPLRFSPSLSGCYCSVFMVVVWMSLGSTLHLRASVTRWKPHLASWRLQVTPPPCRCGSLWHPGSLCNTLSASIISWEPLKHHESLCNTLGASGIPWEPP